MDHRGSKFITVAMLVIAAYSQLNAQLKSTKDSVSYAVGHDFASNLKHQSVDVDLNILIQAIRDVLGSKSAALSDSQCQAVLSEYQSQRMEAQAEKNKKEGDKFLADNKSKDGVVTLPSGLQYKILKAGTGKKPSADQTVSVNYRGTLVDGTEFDNSYKRGEPATFPVNGVIKGWTEALQLMPAGSKWILYIPPTLGYGQHGAGSVIPPNATLIFEVELLEVK